MIYRVATPNAISPLVESAEAYEIYTGVSIEERDKNKICDRKSVVKVAQEVVLTEVIRPCHCNAKDLE